MVELNSLIINSDFIGLESALISYPELANQNIPFDDNIRTVAHPLHRISDAVFSKKITDKQAAELAALFIKYGSKVDGYPIQPCKDSPLIAACSLLADKVALLLIEKGANIHHPGTHGGTALHWAAFCGRPLILSKLVESGADVNKYCFDFKSTPLIWAVQGSIQNTSGSTLVHQKCIQILITNGADKNSLNAAGETAFQLIKKHKLDHLAEILYSNTF